VAKVYVPEKATCMPDKKVFLARAGARYAFLVKEKDFMERANRLFLEGFSHIDPVIYHITSNANALPPQLLPSIFQHSRSVQPCTRGRWTSPVSVCENKEKSKR